MTNDYRHFLRVLARDDPGVPVLFEPLISETICEELIWRRGIQLWDTPEHYVQTMLSLRERTQSDVLVLDLRRFQGKDISRLLQAAERHMPEHIRAVALCGNADSQRQAEASPSVCAIAGFANTVPLKKPFIRMDGGVADAAAEGAAGYYAAAGAEELLDCYGKTIAVCGGLGADWLNGASPLDVYRRSEVLFARTQNRGYALGSGGFGGKTEYLNFISLLGVYIRNR